MACVHFTFPSTFFPIFVDQSMSTMVIQDHTASGPSGASKYTGGGSKPTFARTECSNHKYGGGG